MVSNVNAVKDQIVANASGTDFGASKGVTICHDQGGLDVAAAVLARYETFLSTGLTVLARSASAEPTTGPSRPQHTSPVRARQ